MPKDNELNINHYRGLALVQKYKECSKEVSETAMEEGDVLDDVTVGAEQPPSPNGISTPYAYIDFGYSRDEFNRIQNNLSLDFEQNI